MANSTVSETAPPFATALKINEDEAIIVQKS